MAPRNTDGNPSYKKKNFPVEDNSEVDVNDVIPNLLHKKHKVVKLVKSQLQKIHDDGLLTEIKGMSDDPQLSNEARRKKGFRRSQSEYPKVMMSDMEMTRRSEEFDPNAVEEVDPKAVEEFDSKPVEEFDPNVNEGGNKKIRWWWLLLYLLILLLVIFLLIFLLIFLAAWISAGPLSNYMAHTPIPPGSVVRTDGLCSLEKKYLLRWSKPEYLE